ncbi:hypothetical protein [Arthrobacter sp. PsM3]|uniref:hypothetical protein n=1 Tax=Arthrobacter sp. PsM3 TaxID=3030531 RepID=UPI00263B8C60|nr:hypothetical protein [Arthrobacter sp. PsM3]MDN4645510.1 hypothetical protein [Arthrobacter sp. PsM3]
MLQNTPPEILAMQYGHHLIGLLQNTRRWLKRRVVDMEFIDAETARVNVSLDIDLTAENHGDYVQEVFTGHLPALLIPIGLKNVSYAGLHAVDFEDRHISILTTEQTKQIIDAVADLEELALPWSHLASQLPNSLRLLILPREYLERHDLRYSYLAPFQITDPRHALERFWTAGRPIKFCLDLLGAETPETYHFEIQAPQGSIIHDTCLDTRGSETPGKPPGAAELQRHGGLADRRWKTPRVANIYIRYEGHHPPERLRSHLRYALWLGLDPQNVLLGPMLTALNSALILGGNAIVVSQLQTFTDPGEVTGPYFQGASFFLALATGYLGYMSVPGQHEVSHWLYRSVRRWIMFAGGVTFAGLMASLVGVPLILAADKANEPGSKPASSLMSIATAVVPWASNVAFILALAAAAVLGIVYWRASERGASNYVVKKKDKIGATVNSGRAAATVTIG